MDYETGKNFELIFAELEKINKYLGLENKETKEVMQEKKIIREV